MADTTPAPALESLREGASFTGFYVLSKCDLKETNGNYRLNIELSDATASIAGVIWDNACELAANLKKGLVVKVQGRVGTYNDQLQIKVEKIRPANNDEYDPSVFLPKTTRDVDELKRQVMDYVASLTDPDLARLGLLVFGDERIMREFLYAPGGTKWHHSYLGGLVEHTIGVTDICAAIAAHHPELNRDLLVLAGLLHDIGKIREFTVSTTIEYSDEGRLEGHIVLGERFVRAMCDLLENFPPKLKMLLSHLMLSHQGFKSFSSPVEPMIPEGFVLYYADEIDSKLNALGHITAKGEGKSWSDYNQVLGRFIYLDRDEQGGKE
jgi:3'-5' exoribonuclease